MNIITDDGHKERLSVSQLQRLFPQVGFGELPFGYWGFSVFNAFCPKWDGNILQYVHAPKALRVCRRCVFGD